MDDGQPLRAPLDLFIRPSLPVRMSPGTLSGWRTDSRVGMCSRSISRHHPRIATGLTSNFASAILCVLSEISFLSPSRGLSGTLRDEMRPLDQYRLVSLDLVAIIRLLGYYTHWRRCAPLAFRLSLINESKSLLLVYSLAFLLFLGEEDRHSV